MLTYPIVSSRPSWHCWINALFLPVPLLIAGPTWPLYNNFNWKRNSQIWSLGLWDTPNYKTASEKAETHPAVYLSIISKEYYKTLIVPCETCWVTQWLMTQVTWSVSWHQVFTSWLRALHHKSVFDEIFPSVEHFPTGNTAVMLGVCVCVWAVPKLSTRTRWLGSFTFGVRLRCSGSLNIMHEQIKLGIISGLFFTAWIPLS